MRLYRVWDSNAARRWANVPVGQGSACLPTKTRIPIFFIAHSNKILHACGGERTPVYVLLHVELDRDRDGLPGPRRRGFPATTNPPKNDALGDP